MSPYLDRTEVANKVDWEGGLDAVLEYGLRAEDLPEDDIELREAWQAMELAFHTFDQAADRVRDLLPEAEEF